MHASKARDRLAFALDVETLTEARRWIDLLAGTVGTFKVGLELFCAVGIDAVLAVKQSGARCFLDLKLHDIPQTVARTIDRLIPLGVDLITLHASGGSTMMRSAAERTRGTTTRLLAVTALTSLRQSDLEEIGWNGSPATVVSHLARLASTTGVHGIVCSPAEAGRVRSTFPQSYIVTPGIRAADAAPDDQQRTSTPIEAIRAGADLLVVGRPIRDASDPRGVARGIALDIEGELH